MIGLPPISTLFPYTTLFRSHLPPPPRRLVQRLQPPLHRLRRWRPRRAPSHAEFRRRLFLARGTKMVYSPQSRDFRTEKRYGGGTANQLYIFDVETHDAKKISEGDRASRDPMWIGPSIYYDSDRDGHFNLYSYDVSNGKTTQLTFVKTFDLRWPSTDRDSRPLDLAQAGGDHAARIQLGRVGGGLAVAGSLVGRHRPAVRTRRDPPARRLSLAEMADRVAAPAIQGLLHP